MSSDRRLIEEWLPIAALGEESVRERRSMTALPPTYYLHVWWARRPLVASRAAILASLLPADADHGKFLHALGIHGDPVKAKRLMDVAVRAGTRVSDPYGYTRAFSYAPDDKDRLWLSDSIGADRFSVLDPTAGGGSIPFEALRIGCSTVANDLNPVAATILYATVLFPAEHGFALVQEFEKIAKSFRAAVGKRLRTNYPETSDESSVDATYLFARTITCPYCDGLVPLSPNWKLSSDGTGVKLHANTTGQRTCSFEVVEHASQHSEGTVSDGDARCPYPDCERVIDSDDIKRQAQAEKMGEQLYVVVHKHKKITGYTKQGKEKVKWERRFRAPREADDNGEQIRQRLAEKLSEWEALDLVPTEMFPENTNDDRPIQYGMPLWRDLFSPRQLLCHGTSVVRQK